LVADGACAEGDHTLPRTFVQLSGKEAPMRLPISSVIASLVVALTTPSAPTYAQQSAAGSTIRLTSASEPASDNSSYDSNAQAIPQIQSSEQPADRSVRSLAPPIVHTPVEAPAMNRTRMPAGFYASPEARSTLNQLPGPAPVQSAPRLQTTRRGGKPFQAVPTQPTISPYLYLNAGTNQASPMTNYFAFVRPQLEQAESGRQQQREIQQLRSQLQKMSSTGGGSQASANSNAAAHYMDTAQFYKGLQR
jgi:hypothetical protein